MTFVSEAQLRLLVDMMVNFSRSTYIFSGFSLYQSIIMLFWISSALTLYWFTINLLGGNSD